MKVLLLYSVKRVEMQNFFWSVFSRIWTEYGDLRSKLRIQSKCGKIRTRKTSYLDSFHVVASLATLKTNLSEEERPKSPEHDSHSLKQFLKFFQS